VEDITPWMAERVLANTKNGAHIAWMNGFKIMWRFLSAPITRRQLIDE
jgi:hypothetical protein